MLPSRPEEVSGPPSVFPPAPIGPTAAVTGMVLAHPLYRVTRGLIDSPGFGAPPPFLVPRFTLLGAGNPQHCPDQHDWRLLTGPKTSSRTRWGMGCNRHACCDCLRQSIGPLSHRGQITESNRLSSLPSRLPTIRNRTGTFLVGRDGVAPSGAEANGFTVRPCPLQDYRPKNRHRGAPRFQPAPTVPDRLLGCGTSSATLSYGDGFPVSTGMADYLAGKALAP